MFSKNTCLLHIKELHQLLAIKGESKFMCNLNY